MKIALKWGSNILTVILGLLMVVTMYAAVSSRLSGGHPSVFGQQIYEVLSGSMEPKIHVGSVILDNPHVNTSQLKVGDVITFKAPGLEYGANETIITHRIHKIVDKNGQIFFQTKGDANPTPDPQLVPTSNVIAEYDNFTIPYLGYYLSFMKTKLGIGLLLILPGILLILSTMIGLFREIGKMSKGGQKESSETGSVDTSKA